MESDPLDMEDPSWVMDMGALTLEDCELPGVSDHDSSFDAPSHVFLKDLSDWKVDMSAVSLHDEEVKTSNKQELRAVVDLQRGCRDTDITHECVLTPMLHVAQCGDGSFVIDFGGSSFQSYSPLTPLKKLQGNQVCGEIAASCTYRLMSVDHPASRKEVIAYGTCFAVSSKMLMTVDHCCWKESSNDTYTIVRALPARNEIFQNDKCFRATLIKCESVEALGDEPMMIDPISNDPCCAYGGKMDAIEMFIDNKFGRKETSGRKFFHSMEEFLLPISPTYAIKEYGADGSLSVGILSFPMISEFKDLLDSDEKEDQAKIFDYYKVCFEDYWKSLVASNKELQGLDIKILMKHPKFQSIKLQLFHHIVQVLKCTFKDFATGQMVCSVGKIVGVNETSIAATYSCLQGSSGAAVISPDIKFPGVFLGIHNKPADYKITEFGKIYPDYNIATNVDNPAFVKYYIRNVICTLPVPEAFNKKHEKRLEGFQCWLWQHLKLILRSKAELVDGDDWSIQQGLWFLAMFKQREVQKSLFANELSNIEVSKIATKFMEISHELLQLTRDCVVDQYKFPSSIEELQVQFSDEHHIGIFLAAISPVVRKRGVNVSCWGFRKDTMVDNVNSLQKLALHLG